MDKKKKAKLTPRQSRFVDEYLVDLNATQAAIRAGYSEKTAGRIGPQLSKERELMPEIPANITSQGRRPEQK